ncbi:Hypothetical predicted protein, partial [Paramuricea clavata]
MKRLKIRQFCRKPRSVWVVNGKTDKWWENIVNGNVPDSVWKKNFRMSQLSVFITTAKKLANTLYYLKDTGSLWMTANTFGVHQCTATKIITQLCYAINSALGPTYLHLPR